MAHAGQFDRKSTAFLRSSAARTVLRRGELAASRKATGDRVATERSKRTQHYRPAVVLTTLKRGVTESEREAEAAPELSVDEICSKCGRQDDGQDEH